MKTLTHDELEACGKKLIAFHHEAQQRNEWTFYVDEIYATDCVYTCEYGGTMLVIADGIDQIKATHYGRDMQKGWEGWTFPYSGVYVGRDNKIITHWLNRGPGHKKDGSFYETPGISFITFNSHGKICRQFDMFDLAHQMKLCDELEEAGLLSMELKQNWVIPMKTRLMDQLKNHMDA